MSHTYSQNVLHVIFSTKDRQKTISPDLQPRLWSYIAGVRKKLEILVHAIGGIEDHIHLLIQVPPALCFCVFSGMIGLAGQWIVRAII
jgi:putative transposase